MSYRESNSPFFTPEKGAGVLQGQRGITTTVQSKFIRNIHRNTSPLQKTNQDFQERDGQQLNKTLSILQENINPTEKQGYLSRFRSMRDQQQTNTTPFTQQEEHTGLTLKQIGSKIKGEIRSNSQLKKKAEESQLQIHKNNIQKQIKQSQHTSPNFTNQIEDDPLMKDYIDRTNRRKKTDVSKTSDEEDKTKQNKKIQKKQQKLTQPKSKQEKQPLFNQLLPSVQKMEALKKYFTLYINTVIESNDDRFMAETKYIDSLEKRVIKLEEIETMIEHLKFQKEVKLTSSHKKSKIQSVAGPIVPGDLSETTPLKEELQTDINSAVVAVTVSPSTTFPASPLVPVNRSTPIPTHATISPHPHLHVNPNHYFIHKQKVKIIQDPDVLEELVTLRQQNKNIKQLYQIVKINYQKQIEDHVRDNNQRQKMQYRLKQLESENTFLRQEIKIKKGVTPQ